MRLDPEVASDFARINAVANRTVTAIRSNTDALAMRAQIARTIDAFAGKIDQTGVTIEDHVVPSAAGEISLRLYRPAQAGVDRPCLYFIHGGGMIGGSALMEDARLVPLVREFGCVATSVEYRLAPEHPAPAATYDCYDGLAWVFDKARMLGIDIERIAVGGCSGGGGIAASTALMARDRGLSPCFQLLICPMLDDRHITFSSQQDWLGWNKDVNQGAWKAALGDRYGTTKVTGYEAAARATNLKGLPPTYIEVGAMEVFRDECISYASRLLEAGVPTDLHVYAGCSHGFDLFAPDAFVTRQAVAMRHGALKRAWRNVDE